MVVYWLEVWFPVGVEWAWVQLNTLPFGSEEEARQMIAEWRKCFGRGESRAPFRVCSRRAAHEVDDDGEPIEEERT